MSKKRRYFHRTDCSAAEAILRDGFEDGEGWYGFEVMLSGVWLSSVPLDCNEGAEGDTLVAVTLTTARAGRYEVVETDKPYREYLVPAQVLNRHGRARLVSEDEEARIERRLLKRTQKRLRARWRGATRHVRLRSTVLIRESSQTPSSRGGAPWPSGASRITESRPGRPAWRIAECSEPTDGR